MTHGAALHIVARRAALPDLETLRDRTDDPAGRDPDYEAIDITGRVLGGFHLNLAKDALGRTRPALVPDAAARKNLGLPSDGDDPALMAARGTSTIPEQYSRIADPVPETDLPDLQLLEDAAGAMLDTAGTGPQGTLPAAFTYFGQLIAHDLTRTDPDSLDVFPGNDNPTPPLSLGTHSMDFDTLFGMVTDTPIPPLACAGGGLKLGPLANFPPQDYRDLPRNRTGAPCIADDRNDQNLLLAQMTVAVTRFHAVIAKRCLPNDDDAHRRITRRHLQSIALQDYAPRLVDKSIIDDVTQNGRACVFPSHLAAQAPLGFQVPIEFVAAIGRFGHALVRDRYTLNARHADADFDKLLGFTHLGGRISSHPLINLASDWPVDWRTFGISAHAADQPAQFPGPVVSMGMSTLPPHVVAAKDTMPASVHYNIATLDLMRGHALRLPTAQAMIDHVNLGLEDRNKAIGLPLPPPLQTLSQPDFEALPEDALKPVLSSQSHGKTLADHTPLWLYVMIESATRLPRDGKLGLLGGRIFYETLHAAAQAAPDGIVDAQGTIQFTMDDRLPWITPDDGTGRMTLANLLVAI